LSFLRGEQAHRRLGFSHAQMEQWAASAGLQVEAAEDFAPDLAEGGLTVTIWSVIDQRAADARHSAETT
jgi:ArsR family transcriptional regulator